MVNRRIQTFRRRKNEVECREWKETVVVVCGLGKIREDKSKGQK